MKRVWDWNWDQDDPECPEEPKHVTIVYDEDGWEYRRSFANELWYNPSFPQEVFTWGELMEAYSPLHEENPS